MLAHRLAYLTQEAWLLAADLIDLQLKAIVCRAIGHATPLVPHRMAARTIHYCPRCKSTIR